MAAWMKDIAKPLGFTGEVAVEADFSWSVVILKEIKEQTDPKIVYTRKPACFCDQQNTHN